MFIIIGLFILMVLFWIGFKITGAILSAIIWLCIKLPVALVLWCVGILLCCTIILIPVGKGCIKLGTAILV